MATLWPWLAIAGLGALHGLNPANGWAFAASRGLRAGQAAQAWRALLPIALGHGAAVAIVAWLATRGGWLEPALWQRLAGALLLGVAVHHGLRPAATLHAARGRATFGVCPGPLGLGLWSALMATAHGTGLMLVPLLLPLCAGAARVHAFAAADGFGLALAAVGVHLAAMLLAAAAIATGVCRGLARMPSLLGGRALHHLGTALLATTAVLMLWS